MCPHTPSRRLRLFVGGSALVIVALVANCGGTPTEPTPTEPSPAVPPTVNPAPGPTPTPTPPPPPVVQQTAVFVGAGDIGWCGSTAPRATADLLDRTDGVIFTTGDHAYPSGTEAQFRDCYDPAWGRLRGRTRPSPGNHDYETPGASPYYSYFGASAGPAGQGYYSYDLGAWHIVSLNSITASSAQARWLRQDLASVTAKCTLAYWHDPVFSSGPNGNQPQMREVWRILHEAGADVIVNGDDHLYERFAPQDPDGRREPLGIRQFTVGTGGAPLHAVQSIQPNSEIRSSTFGVLRFTLKPDGYEWEFMPIPGESFRDSGAGECH